MLNRNAVQSKATRPTALCLTCAPWLLCQTRLGPAHDPVLLPFLQQVLP